MTTTTPDPASLGEIGLGLVTAAIYGVDAFTDTPFRGNPAAVCVLQGPASAAWMQAVAAEMNLSETAFLVPSAEGWSLRWFTPKVEIDLCGHATLASAHVLWSTGRLPESEEAVFRTQVSGVLRCVRKGSWISMDFPGRTAREGPGPDGLLEALGCNAVWVGAAERDAFVQVASAAVVQEMRPDFARLRRVPVRGVIVTAAGTDGGFDFVSRFFAPGLGIDEDPVTGSAHCALAPYWGALLGKTEMRGWQASARGGEVGVIWRGDRVDLIGRAATVWRGEWGAGFPPLSRGAGS